jgi:4-amino-4-deoxy-L-arabinose transferase-like glycosyltransferase
MPYEPSPIKNSSPKRRLALWLLALTLLSALGLGMRELRPREALLASVATEMRISHDWLTTTVQSRPAESFPLYSWMLTGLGSHRLNEWEVRLPALLGLLGLSLISAMMAGKAGGTEAGIVAAVVPLSAFACLRMGQQASHETLFAFFMAAAWFAWYHFGRVEKHWWKAWLCSLLLVALATFTGGAKAIVCFYWPIFFLHRPLNSWRRMLLPSHLVSLLLAVVIIGAWLIAAPNQVFFPWSAASFQQISGGGGVLRGTLRFFWQCGVLLFPWVFLAWPAFCAAFKPVETEPVLFLYLRTIVVALFLACWFLPGVSAEALLLLMGPLAVMTGLHYEILMRRYSRQLHGFARALARVGVLLAILGLALGALQIAGVVVLVGLSKLTVLKALAGLALALVCALWAAKTTRAACWQRLTLAIMALNLIYSLFWLAMVPQLQGTRRDSARRLASQVPESVTVYKMVEDLLVSECYYMARPVVQVADVEMLPKDQDVVYVLAGAKAPVLETRTWTEVSEPVPLKPQARAHLDWHPQGRCLLRVELRESLEEPSQTVRMYRGNLRPPVEEVSAKLNRET